MIKRRFYKLEHGDKDSGSDSSCFSSDSDPESEEEESEQSQSEDAVAEGSEDDDDSVSEGGEEEDDSPAADVEDDDEDSDGDAYRGRYEKTSMQYGLEEPPEEEEDNYILGCMIKCKSVYKCRYCPNTICLNERTMQEHVSSKNHARSEKLMKEAKLGTDDEDVDDPETPSQEKQVKGNRKSRRQGMISQKQEQGSSITDGEKAHATAKTRKKMRQTKD
ncbi:PREDICTED: myelin transcription factor 1-like protein isoform X5 [Brassica oleracea var. oleracea]|uniref:myelin transcription factor 1-like protein isoform X5 n=1 Tax=Brassica oleracea var. oleracea TaxID=109376 RepID=UPI0006A6EB17|nr:PREDICTED: myelin transcription factor 1-like protein isoform X5 [Brassica oleracea var. oleracea]